MGAKAGKSGPGKPGQGGKSAGINRLALVIFGGLFIALFVIFAVAEGIGDPSVPAGDVAIVKGVPDGTVSEAQYKRAFLQQVTQASLKKAPKAGSKKFEEIKKATVGELVEAIWVRGEAEELGITVTKKQVESEIAQVKKQNFKTAKAFKEFLETSHYTAQDVHDKIELNLLSQQIQKQISNQAPPPSKAEISAYYDSAKASQFTTKPSRDIRLILNKKKSEVEKAKQALEADSSPASWKKVAAKYSTDPTSKTKGGLTKGISEELLQGAVKKAIFGSATNELVGPINYQGNYLLVEVVKLNPEKVKALSEVSSQISSQLAQQAQQEHLTEFVSGYQSKWRSRTFCSADFLVEHCANYRGTGHPATAPEACYEANPKAPVSECPAPVEQTKPALPGSVTLLKPTGERLVQRPQPSGGASATEGAPVPGATEAPPAAGG